RRRLRGSQRQGQPVSKPEVPTRSGPSPPGRIDGPSRRRGRQRRHGELLQPAAEERAQPPHLDHPRRTADRDRHLDRTDLPPATPASLSRPIDPDRVRGHHEHASRPGCVTTTVTYPCSRPSELRSAVTASHKSLKI